MHGSQPKLSSAVLSSVSWDLFLGFYRQDFDLLKQSQWSLEKTAKIWGRHNWFLRKMTFGNDCRNFILATSCVTTQIWVVLLIAIFPRHMTNQKHYPDLGIGILGDPGADSGDEGKSKRAEKCGTKKSKERREEPLGTMTYQTSSKGSPPF